ncbi:LOW QUALITY PROTEIN: hypothetical protein PoB_001019700 [Plakobranchus ocellatus]|uniref:Uncharacterized protein n=1 Tax=Plakobranchus ocellatus TaxID=259542 RepID=A0AAV3YNJ3_9GAST|nr:LOW QUALITY PROTEIN: hypothetical protein PoB_001019700 [Plakobranchus ocellatus]
MVQVPMENDPDLLSKIIFSDEATFHLSGKMNNVRIWGTQNPHATLEFECNSPKMNVYCAITERAVDGPFFFEGLSITGSTVALMIAGSHNQKREKSLELIYACISRSHIHRQSLSGRSSKPKQSQQIWPAVMPATKPVRPMIKPVVPVIKPVVPVIKPVVPAIKPVRPAIKPVVPAIKPVMPAIKPVMSACGASDQACGACDQACDACDQACGACDQACDACYQACDACDQACGASDQACGACDQACDACDQACGAELVVPAIKPVMPAIKPVVPAIEPVVPVIKPVMPAIKPGVIVGARLNEHHKADVKLKPNNYCPNRLVVGRTVVSESALRSAGTLLSRVRAPPSGLRPGGGLKA